MFPSGRQVAEVAEELEEVSLMVHHQVGVAAENLQQLLRYHLPDLCLEGGNVVEEYCSLQEQGNQLGHQPSLTTVEYCLEEYPQEQRGGLCSC